VVNRRVIEPDEKRKAAYGELFEGFRRAFEALPGQRAASDT